MTIQNYSYNRLKTKIIDEMHLLTIYLYIYPTKIKIWSTFQNENLKLLYIFYI